MKRPPTLARLRELFKYDRTTGNFTRNVSRGGEVSGSIAGNIDITNGYARLRVDGALYPSHRLAWLYETGKWPPECIDHINGIKHDNRICNLRLATVTQNNQHVHAPRSDSRSGYRGVSWSKVNGMWRATITVGGRQKHIGYFDDPYAAHMAYVAAKAAHHPFSSP